MPHAHILGFPRIGNARQYKKAVEAYWKKEISREELLKTGNKIQTENWQLQKEASLDFITVGDFSWYDHVLETSTLFGVVGARFGEINNKDVDSDTFFCMARGLAPNGLEAPACEMTKWFNTNYHYIVPEFTQDQNFRIANSNLFNSIESAKKVNHPIKAVILGPLSFLWLGKIKGKDFDKLELLEKLIPVYNEVFARLAKLGVEWVQIDEPILVLDLPANWQQAFTKAYAQLNFSNLKSLLTTYFGDLKDNLSLAAQLPVSGLHIDIVSAPSQLDRALKAITKDQILSVGIVNGRNIWRNDLAASLKTLQTAYQQLDDRLWISSSCSLLHAPVDLEREEKLDPELKSWLAFAKQKIKEVALLKQGIKAGERSIESALNESNAAAKSRKNSAKIHNAKVQSALNAITPNMYERIAYPERAKIQRKVLKLPALPTTTIGSFPQTEDIRHVRQQYKTGKITQATYETEIKKHIAHVIQEQENLNLDVLVHGEAERNDMVEYFGELLNGFAFTANGWVQSYGSRCVKPPIIFGDISRSQPLTVAWSQYAQSLTSRLVKGMLTGPVTILAWSFVRDDQALATTATQIALALREEVQDLEKAGIHIIQIDEPAFREIMPLRREDWQNYFDWSVKCFRLAAAGISAQTQIHTHMCYSEFNDIIEAIAALDADVITLENSRSDSELLNGFEKFSYPNEIGPGVYDIHSPRIPSIDEFIQNIDKALQYIPVSRLWINPDCGLKTRNWPEVKKALNHMVQATKTARIKFSAMEIEA